MFEKLKALFQRKKAEQPKPAAVPHAPIAIAPIHRRPSAQRVATPAPTRPAEETCSDGDFATSYLVGMATNNALMGHAVGGNMAGAIAGDIARDGSLFEASRSGCDSPSSDSWSSSCDSSSSSSCCGD